jgi:hypothetical protein
MVSKFGDLPVTTHSDRRPCRCFYINLPFGAAVAVICFFLYRPPPEKHDKVSGMERVKRLDPVGLILFVGSMVSLILALQFGGVSGTWSEPRIIVLFTMFGVLFLAFAGYETWLGEDATLPPRIAKNRTVMAASVFVLCIDAPYYAIAYYVRLVPLVWPKRRVLIQILTVAHLLPSGTRRFRFAVWYSIYPSASWRTPFLSMLGHLHPQIQIFRPGCHCFQRHHVNSLRTSFLTYPQF